MNRRTFELHLELNRSSEGSQGQRIFTPLGIQFNYHDDGCWCVQIFLVAVLLSFGWMDVS